MRDELPSHRHTLPFGDIENDDRGAARDSEPIEPYGMHRLEEDVAEIKEVLGKPPAPGRPGSGLVGAVCEMQRTIERLVSAEEARAKTSTPPASRRLVSRPAIIALIAALGGGGGIAGIIHAARGGDPPPAQTQGRAP